MRVHGINGALVLPLAAMFLAVQGATTVCVGGAAINLARSVRTMHPADAACFSKRGAACRLAHFPAATAVLAARSFRCRYGGGAATAERAEPIGAVYSAKPTSLRSCATLCSRTDLFLHIMLHAHPPCYSVAAAAFGRAGQFVSGMLHAHPFPFACVGGAPRHCAGPMRTMFDADA